MLQENKKKQKTKTLEDEGDGDTYFCNCTWNDDQKTGKGKGTLENQRTIGDYSNNSMVKISLNTEKSRGDLRRLAVSRILMRHHHLTLIWKTLKGVNNDNEKRSISCNIADKSSSSRRAASTDIPDPLSPLLPITHRLRQVFRVTSCVLT